MTNPSWDSLQLVSEPTILGAESTTVYNQYHYPSFTRFATTTTIPEIYFHGSPYQVQSWYSEQQPLPVQCAYRYNQMDPNFNSVVAANYSYQQNLHHFQRPEYDTFPSAEQHHFCQALHSEQKLPITHAYDSTEIQGWESEQSLIASKQSVFDELLSLVRENIRRFEQCRSDLEAHQQERATYSDSPKLEINRGSATLVTSTESDDLLQSSSHTLDLTENCTSESVLSPSREISFGPTPLEIEGNCDEELDKIEVHVFDKFPMNKQAEMSRVVHMFDKIPNKEQMENHASEFLVSSPVILFGPCCHNSNDEAPLVIEDEGGESLDTIVDQVFEECPQTVNGLSMNELQSTLMKYENGCVKFELQGSESVFQENLSKGATYDKQELFQETFAFAPITKKDQLNASLSTNRVQSISVLKYRNHCQSLSLILESYERSHDILHYNKVGLHGEKKDASRFNQLQLQLPCFDLINSIRVIEPIQTPQLEVVTLWIHVPNWIDTGQKLGFNLSDVSSPHSPLCLVSLNVFEESGDGWTSFDSKLQQLCRENSSSGFVMPTSDESKLFEKEVVEINKKPIKYAWVLDKLKVELGSMFYCLGGKLLNGILLADFSKAKTPKVTDHFEEMRNIKIIYGVDQYIIWVCHNLGMVACNLLDAGQGTNLRKSMDILTNTFMFLKLMSDTFKKPLFLLKWHQSLLTSSITSVMNGLGVQSTFDKLLEVFMLLDLFPLEMSVHVKKLLAENIKESNEYLDSVVLVSLLLMTASLIRSGTIFVFEVAGYAHYTNLWQMAYLESAYSIVNQGGYFCKEVYGEVAVCLCMNHNDKESIFYLEKIAAYKIEGINKNYFGSLGSYEFFGDLISDNIRDGVYKQTILENPTLLKGVVVMDIGCGTGTLSIFAAQAKASRMIAVEASGKMAVVGVLITKGKNLLWSRGEKEDYGLENDVMEVVRGMVEELQSTQKVQTHYADMLEWISYCLLYKSVLSLAPYACDQFLKLGVPKMETMFIAGFGREVNHCIAISLADILEQSQEETIWVFDPGGGTKRNIVAVYFTSICWVYQCLQP